MICAKLYGFKYSYLILIIFQQIYFSVDGTQTGTTTPGVSERGNNNNNDGVHYTCLIPRTRASPSDAFLYRIPDHSLGNNNNNVGIIIMMMAYTTLAWSPELEPHHQMHFYIVSKTILLAGRKRVLCLFRRYSQHNLIVSFRVWAFWFWRRFICLF